MRLREEVANLLLEGQSGFARKVYDFVPIGEAFTETQLVNSIVRSTGNIPSKAILQACLRDLADAGLIQCRGRRYQRTPIKEKRAKEKAMPDSTPIAVAPVGPIELLGGLAEQLLQLNKTFTEQMTKLAAGIEEAALKIEQEQESNKGKLVKLQQLQTILNELGKE